MPKSLRRSRKYCAHHSRVALWLSLLLLVVSLPADLPFQLTPQAAGKQSITNSLRRTASEPGRGRDSQATDLHAVPTAPPSPATGAVRDRLKRAYGQLPLTFEANQGQTDARVRFIARGSGYTLFLTPTEAVLKLRRAKGAGDKEDLHTRETHGADDGFESSSRPATLSSEVRLRLVNANPSPKVGGLGEQEFKSNYFIADDVRRWHRSIPNYEKVKYKAVYPGIDLLYYGNQQQLEYDFLLAPGSDPRRIKFAIAGAQKISLDKQGDLVLQTPSGEVRQRRPVAYQEVNGKRRAVASRYRIDRQGRIGFELGSYDKSRPLVIDPVLLYSTFMGGNGFEEGHSIAVDGQGNAYLAGYTNSIDFPVSNPIQTSNGGFDDAFVLKLNASGTALVYATYIGGTGTDVADAIAIDAQDNAYITGRTSSGNFPRTAGAFQQTSPGGADAFVTKLNASGTALVYSTLLGGNNFEEAFDIAVDAGGNAYVTGQTDSTDFLTPGSPDMKKGSPAFKSSNQGGNWNAVENGLTARSVRGFSIDPSNPNTLYAATSSGVFKTTDAGSLWRLTGTTRPSTNPPLANAVAVDPSAPNTIYAAGLPCRVYKSTNGGDIYEEKTLGLFGDAINAILIHPTTTSTLYIGTTRGVYKSTNGGDNWTISSAGLTTSGTGSNYLRTNELAFDPTNPSTIYAGTTRGVYKTTNAGGSWSPINGNNFQLEAEVQALAVDPLNPLTLYAGNFYGVFKTTDGGNSWTLVFNGPVTSSTIPLTFALAVDPSNSSIVYAGTNGRGIYRSTDGGGSWSTANLGITNYFVNALVIDTTSPATVYAGVDGNSDAFLVKLNPTGSLPVYFMYLGGDEFDGGSGVDVDAQGNAYVVGSTSSTNYPTANAFQSSSGGNSDAFLTKVNADGSALVYSTYLGGSSGDFGREVAIDGASNVYLTGSTSSTNFPVANALQPALTQFSNDAFITKFNADASALVYSTFLGGSNNDVGVGIAVHASGSAYITGSTGSFDFPVNDAIQPAIGGGTTDDAFVANLSPSGAALIYSTYLGGSSADGANSIALDSFGNAYITGVTISHNFPTASPLQSTLKGFQDAFVAKLGSDADLSITKTDSRDPVMVNNSLTYTLKVTNNGPEAATGVTATDTLPAGLTLISATPTQGTCNASGAVVTCHLGNLPAQNSATISIVVTPTATGNLSNTANVTGQEPDSNPANNSATQTTRVSASPSIVGRVTDAGGNGQSGVTVTLSGSTNATTQTDSNGIYSFIDLAAGGTYIVTPTKTGFSFDPQSQTFANLNADQTANFLAAACTYTLSPVNQSFNAAGGSGSVAVTSLNGCPWTASSNADWITITSGASGNGSGTVSYTVAPTTAPRSGRLTIAGKHFAVYQEVNSCGAPGFTFANYSSAGSQTEIQSADLNGDGRPDLVTSTGGGTSGGGVEASVLLNDGAGSFTSSNFNTGLGVPLGFALGDFNGDSRPDIAMTSYNYSFVKIFFNNGSGGFGQSTTLISLGSQDQAAKSRGMRATDVNRDGKADLLIPTFSENALHVLLGNGAGGFGTPIPVNLGQLYFLFNVADVNHDGAPDLLLGNGSFSRQFKVMLGDGNGSFSTSIVSSEASLASDVVTNDFDGDGNLDVAMSSIVNDPSGSNKNVLLILAGDGSGHFKLKSTFGPTATHIARLATADFNGDAKSDVAYTTGGNALFVLLGDGAGSFGVPTQVNFGPETQFSGGIGITTSDFNGDAKPDLAVADYSRGVSVLTNTCSTSPFIAGRVTNNHTGGLAGVTLTLTGSQTATTQTDSGGNYFFGNLTAGGNYTVTPSKDSYTFNPVSTVINNLNGSARADFTVTPISVQFAAIHYLADEGQSNIKIEVTRTGDTSHATIVNYATENGTASDRSDYTTALGALHFAPGEVKKSFNIFLTDDLLVEGYENLTLVLRNPTGAILGFPSTVLMEIRDNDIANGQSPVKNGSFNSGFFVRQHYIDFFNREPDASGLAFWKNQIDECETRPEAEKQGCREIRRINVSGAFFVSTEFQETGYLVYRLHQVAFNTGERLGMRSFISDAQEIGKGVVVGQGEWKQQLENNKQSLINAFVMRPEFVSLYGSLTPQQYVNALDANTGNSLTPDEVAVLVNSLSTNQLTRAQVLRAVAENAEFSRRQLNRAFVYMQYIGYLRREPDAGGFQFWLTKLENHNGNYISAEMVKAFITSGEYEQRFGL